jgi:23S rRNA (pseudouridine1915-N3)-methyltransferase
MRTLICTVGKPKLQYARMGVQEYLGRLERYGRAGWVQVREGTRAQESQRLLEVSEGMVRVLLDERGTLADTLALHERMAQWEMQAEKAVAFLIGGAEGHSDALRAQADWMLSLSRLTLQHELALVVLLEQLYRVQTIKRGEPYHRR